MSQTLLTWVDPATGLIDSVEFDVVESETHEDTLELTRHPVEVGAAITDHAVEQPTLVTIEGFVGDAPNKRLDKDAAIGQIEASLPGFADPGTQQIPLDFPTAPLNPFNASGLVQAGIGALKSAIAGQPKGTFRGKARAAAASLTAQMLQQSAPRSRPRDVYEKLLAAQSKRALITVSTALREHFDMVLTRLPPVQNDDTGNGVAFSVDFERIKVADSQTVQSPEPAEKRGAAGVSGGSRNGKDDPSTDQKNVVAESTLSSITP